MANQHSVNRLSEPSDRNPLGRPGATDRPKSPRAPPKSEGEIALVSAGSPSIWRFLSRRAGYALALIFAVIVFNFILIHAAPGDPVTLMTGESGSPESYQQLRARYGLDRPILEQLLRYLATVARGNLGFSFTFQRPVTEVIVQRVPATLLLTGTAILLSSVLGVLLGTLAALRQRTLLDTAITAASVAGYSIPIFWLAQMLLIIFALRLRWLPAVGMSSLYEHVDFAGRVVDVLRHLVLPATSLTIFYLTLVTRLTRVKMIENLHAQYVVTARAKGLPPLVVIFRHALPNAIPPVITVIGYSFGLMFAGSVLTETVFAWPGLGRLIFDAVFSRDYPLLMAIFIFISVSVVLFNVVADLLHGLIDPRIRYG